MRSLDGSPSAVNPRPRCFDGTLVRTRPAPDRAAPIAGVVSAPPPSQRLTGTRLAREPVALTGRPEGAEECLGRGEAPDAARCVAANHRRGSEPTGLGCDPQEMFACRRECPSLANRDTSP